MTKTTIVARQRINRYLTRDVSNQVNANKCPNYNHDTVHDEKY